MSNCPKCNAPPIATVAKAEWECGSYIPKGMKSIQRSDTCCCSEAIARCEELESQLHAERAAHEVTKAELAELRRELDFVDDRLSRRPALDGSRAERIDKMCSENGKMADANTRMVREVAELRSTQASLQQQLREATSKLGAWELDAKIQGWRREDAGAKEIIGK